MVFREDYVFSQVSLHIQNTIFPQIRSTRRSVGGLGNYFQQLPRYRELTKLAQEGGKVKIKAHLNQLFKMVYHSIEERSRENSHFA